VSEEYTPYDDIKRSIAKRDTTYPPLQSAQDFRLVEKSLVSLDRARWWCRHLRRRRRRWIPSWL